VAGNPGGQGTGDGVATSQGPEVFLDADGQRWMVLHASVGDAVGYPEGARNLFVLRLEFTDGQPIAA
jgi:hypothetical protein